MAKPQQEESGQELYTRDHGTVKVAEKSWIDGGYHIVLCPNGTYQHANGLPVRDEKELRIAFGTNREDLEQALHWFKNRHDQGENPVRPIGFNSDNVPVFADGTVADFPDLYAFFRPGPILTAAIVALQQHRDRAEIQTKISQTQAQKPKPAVKVTPPAPAALAPKALVSGPEKYSPRARGEAAAKAKRAKARAAKAAAKPAPDMQAPAQVTP
jgi:hypothetical protein